MAFKDSNGRITIDEIAAQKDTQNLSAAMENYNSAINQLNQIASLAAEFKGETANSISESTVLIRQEIETLVSSISESIGFINSTVSKYQQIDSNLKTIIESF